MENRRMFSQNSLAAAVLGIVALSGPASAQCPPCPCPTVVKSITEPIVKPVTSAAAYQSWLAWYHARPAATADAGGARFRQLLAAADGDLYFLKGLDDTSPQVRELSQRGLIEAPTNRSRRTIAKRASSPNEQVRRQALAILAATNHSADDGSWAVATDTAEAAETSAADSPSGFWLGTRRHEPASIGATPFTSVAHGAALARYEAGTAPDDCSQCGLEADVMPLDGCRPRQGFFARRQSCQATSVSALELLALLDQTGPLALLESVSVEEITRALKVHLGLPATAGEAACGSIGYWHGRPPVYRAEFVLGRHRQESAWDAAYFYHSNPEFERSIESAFSRPHEPIVGDEGIDNTLAATAAAPRAGASLVPFSLTCTWCDSPYNGLSLAPGTYRLQITFQPSVDVRLGLNGCVARPAMVGNIVFQVIAAELESHRASGAKVAMSKASPGQPTVWQIISVAVGKSTAPWADPCTPSVSSITDRDQLVNFSMSLAR
jgi:hypothetical protein